MKIMRKSFGRQTFSCVPSLPDLVYAHQEGYRKLVEDYDYLQSLLEESFNIEDPKFSLRCVQHKLIAPILNEQEHIERGLNYAGKLRATLEVTNLLDGKVISIEIYVGEIPYLTPSGSFIIHGIERTLVYQLHKSPGILFTQEDKGESYKATVMPEYGSWITFVASKKGHIGIKIDKKKVVNLNALLAAFGIDRDSALVQSSENVLKIKVRDQVPYLDASHIQIGKSLPIDIYFNNEILIKVGDLVTKAHIKTLDSKDNFAISAQDIIGMPILSHLKLGENYIIREDLTDLYEQDNISVVLGLQPIMVQALCLGEWPDQLEGRKAIFSSIRPNEKASDDTINNYFLKAFTHTSKFNLSVVGRDQLNRSCKLDSDSMYLDGKDVLAIAIKLSRITSKIEAPDNVDSLSSRKLKDSKQMLTGSMREGLRMMSKNFMERMRLATEFDKTTLRAAINSKLFSTQIKELFVTGSLCQLLEQNNPLSSLSHKRRMSSMGPGGLNKGHSGFEARDVHNSYFGKICPVETPEGPNIGLVNSMAVRASMDEHGFLQTPYWIVKDGQVTQEMVTLSFNEEREYYITQASEPRDSNNHLINSLVECRHEGEIVTVANNKVNLIDVSTEQLISASAALIPFFEHNDANRCLMGSNMQRQAVPCLFSDKPLIGTGIESKIARDSRVCIIAQEDGTVIRSDSGQIYVAQDDTDQSDELNKPLIHAYKLQKYQHNNNSTCNNQVATVKTGDKVKKGDILADGYCINAGELSLGQNTLVAFMPFYGYNFEDAIVVSEKFYVQERMTSLHIEEFVCYAQTIKSGQEEITNDIPGLQENQIDKLDSEGVVLLGSTVQEGDILVGKLTPKAETKTSPEEKLLQAIFGNKTSDMKDTSLRYSLDSPGVVIGIRKINNEGLQVQEHYDHQVDLIAVVEEYVQKQIGTTKSWKWIVEHIDTFTDKHQKLIKQAQEQVNRLRETREEVKPLFMSSGVNTIVKVFVCIQRRLERGDKLSGRYGNKGVIANLVDTADMPYLADGTPVEMILNPLGIPSRMNIGQLLEVQMGMISKTIGKMLDNVKDQPDKIRELLEKVYSVSGFDPQEKTKILQASDEELIELAHSYADGLPLAIKPFNSPKSEDIQSLSNLCGLPQDGMMDLYDGYTGKKIPNKVFVGYMYTLKLEHLVSIKIHARATGRYSMISQQPLGGKSQFGGQRLGEMESCALQAYGAANILQEMLTVKSDDIAGRNRVYQNIVQGELHKKENALPESFKVLKQELKALCLQLDMINDQEEE